MLLRPFARPLFASWFVAEGIDALRHPAVHATAGREGLAALFEVALVICFLTGAFFREAALLAAVYVIFLAFAFHGPSRWAANQGEFGFFVDHFTFLAGLLFAAVHGPGDKLASRLGIIWK